MRFFKVKLIFGTFLFLLAFLCISLIVSVRYLDVPEDSDSLDVNGILDEISESNKKFSLRNLQHKLNRVQALSLKKLKKTKHCRLQCKYAVDYYNSGIRMSLTKSESKVRIMMYHCLHCLMTKGMMGKIRERSRRKRELSEQMKITPNIQSTKPMKIAFPDKSANDYKHNVFGGWLSDVFRSRNKAKKSISIPDSFNTRNLLNVVKETADKAKVLPTPKKPLVIKQEDDDEDYENNYEDNFDRDVPDLEKQAQKTQDALTYFLIGAFAFFALLFMFVFPLVSFLRMCCKHFHSNAVIVLNILCCRDPKYILVRAMCVKCDVPIPDYRLYKELIREYEAKDAKTIAREERKKNEDELKNLLF